MTLARFDSHAIAGVVPPRQNEAMIREVWQNVTASSGIAGLARKCLKSIVLAPLGWLFLAPIWATRFLGFLPGMSFLTTKYTITNRRVMIRKGVKAKSSVEIPLNQIGDVRIKTDANTDFFGTATLEVLRQDGSVALTMTGVPEPEGFRQTILQTRDAWSQYL